jgi:hypothetical protein
MKVAIMQPYFFPYIGYFQLINSVDNFIIYDNIEFTKKGWINRNRILVNGKDEFITLPLKKDSDFLYIRQRFLADSFHVDKQKILRRIKESYRKAPYFDDAYMLVEEVFNFNHNNLFDFIFNSIKTVCSYLEIKTEFIVSSKININHNLKSEEKVLAICKYFGADTYINAIGGRSLYSHQNFKSENIELRFIQSNEFSYKQFDNDFLPWLSIVDLIMFNSKSVLTNQLNNFKIE